MLGMKKKPAANNSLSSRSSPGSSQILRKKPAAARHLAKEKIQKRPAASHPCHMEKVANRSLQFTHGLALFLGLSAADALRTVSHAMSRALVNIRDAILAAFPQRLCVVGGGDEDRSKGDLFSAEYYDPERNEWRELPGMNVRRYAPAVCRGRGMLYACGGEVWGPNGRRSVERLNPTLGRWEIVEKMARCHTTTVPVALGDHIYVCGGGFACYDDSAERYSMIENRWEKLPNMPCTRNDGTAMVWQDRVLLVAGVNSHDNDLATSTCVSFDPSQNRWADAMTLQTPRQGAACALLNGELYVCGGNGSEFIIEDEQGGYPEALRLVERYRFADETWETLPPMLDARYAAAAAVLGGQLYIVGGADGSQCLRSAERFDPATNSWYRLPPMLSVRVRPGAAAIREVVDKDPNLHESEPSKYSDYEESRSENEEEDSNEEDSEGEDGEEESAFADLCACGKPAAYELGSECWACYDEH